MRKPLNITECKRAIKRGNTVCIGLEIEPISCAISRHPIQFSDFQTLKDYVKRNGFHGLCYIVPKS